MEWFHDCIIRSGNIYECAATGGATGAAAHHLPVARALLGQAGKRRACGVFIARSTGHAGSYWLFAHDIYMQHRHKRAPCADIVITRAYSPLQG